MSDCIDIWRSIPELEGFYEVSQNGLVRSVTRTINGRTYQGRMMKQWFVQRRGLYGEWQVGLRKVGQNHSMAAHTAVALAFLEKPDSAIDVHHKDGNPNNNNVENLAWVDRAISTQAAYRRGLMGAVNAANALAWQGEKAPKAKLTAKGIVEIRKSKKTGAELALLYSVTRSTISKIRLHKTWRHIP
jgi:hypothetical protein